MKTKFEGERWEGSWLRPLPMDNKTFENVLFQELVVRHARLRGCRFINCEFKNCYLGFNARYRDCFWSRCEFHGKYSALGSKGDFDRCRFDDVLLQSESCDGVTFRHCTISGKLRNMIWRGGGPRRGRFVLRNCDLSGSVFENIDIYNGVDLSSVVLPSSGIRVFRNRRGAFSKALREAGKALRGDKPSVLCVLGNADCHDRQNPVVFDTPSLEGLLSLEADRSAFEKMAGEFEVAR